MFSTNLAGFSVDKLVENGRKSLNLQAFDNFVGKFDKNVGGVVCASIAFNMGIEGLQE
jgi:hypothetical protein